MPQATLSAASLSSRLGEPVTRERLEPLLFRSKAELSRWEGDELVLEATPDRIDLLTESGLALYLAGVLGSRGGLQPVPRWTPSGSAPVIEVDRSTEAIRPAIGATLLSAPDGAALDADLLSEAIRFQELLHATRGADRRVASLGIYPWQRLESPIRYSVEPSGSFRFVPLGQEEELTGTDFLSNHPMAQRYGAFGIVGNGCLTLRDANGTVLSLPPILNSRSGGEARVGDRVLLLESTGIRPAAVQDMLGLLLMVFVARGWRAAPVRVRSSNGEESGESVIEPHSLSLSAAGLETVSGRSWDSREAESAIAAARLGSRSTGQGWKLEASPWRPDLQSEIDAIEDLVLARGVEARDGLVAPSVDRGRRSAESRFRARVGELLLGLGYVELHNTILTGRAEVDRLGRPESVALVNSPSELYSVFRHSLLLPLLRVLEHNVRFGYPQRLFEVGPVVVRDAASETGTQTRYHAAALLASDRAGFSDAAAVADYVLVSLGASGVREPASLPGTIPGRAAVVRLAGERVAELGEIHPERLTEIRVPVPAVWAEWDLTSLWPLMRRGEAD